MSLILNTPPADGDHLLNRIRAEYDEMPGLRVTKAQGQRLWGLDEAGCAAVLAGTRGYGVSRAHASRHLRQGIVDATGGRSRSRSRGHPTHHDSTPSTSRTPGAAHDCATQSGRRFRASSERCFDFVTHVGRIYMRSHRTLFTTPFTPGRYRTARAAASLSYCQLTVPVSVIQPFATKTATRPAGTSVFTLESPHGGLRISVSVRVCSLVRRTCTSFMTAVTPNTRCATRSARNRSAYDRTLPRNVTTPSATIRRCRSHPDWVPTRAHYDVLFESFVIHDGPP